MQNFPSWPKPTARLSGWGAGSLAAKPRFMTSAQLRRMRRRLSDLDAKLRQMTAAERDERKTGQKHLDFGKEGRK